MFEAIARSSRRRWTLVLVSLSACVLATTASAHRSDFRPGKWPSSTVLIGYSNEQALEAALRGRGATVVGRAGFHPAAGFRPAAGDESLVLTDEAALRRPDDVATVLVAAGHPPTGLTMAHDDLESHFLRLVGGGAGKDGGDDG